MHPVIKVGTLSETGVRQSVRLSVHLSDAPSSKKDHFRSLWLLWNINRKPYARNQT